MLRRVIETGEAALNVEFEVDAPNGRGRQALVGSYYPIRASDGTVAALGTVVVDVTERKRNEEALQREAEFRERVLGIVGHDLRTPLNAILFSAATLLRREAILDGEARALRRISTSAERMNRMIGDLLDVTRVRQGTGIPLARRPIDLRKVCEQVVDEVRVAYPARQVQLVAHGGCQGDWDPDRVAQVVSNLVVNALDYSPADTPVRVDVGGVDAHSVELRVHNAGPPIASERVATLFEPFKRGRAGPSPTSAGRGLGLGLFIAREIVRAHGGSIEVRSSADEGTRFVVRLPRDLSGAET